MSELPLVVVNCQRGGPSTGLPTKTEQSDLYQAVYGRNGDAPLVVIASRSPSDCFEVAIEAVRLAVQFMTPVILLTDGYIANAAEPWRLPDLTAFQSFAVEFFDRAPAEGRINPYARDPETLKRIWIKPGTPGLTHRIGGIEKSFTTGEISYDPANHQKMTDTRKAKIDGIANFIPEQEVSLGTPGGKLAVVGWGSTFGAIHQAVRRARSRGADVSHIHHPPSLAAAAESGDAAAQLRAHPCSGNEYRPAEDGTARPVSRRRQAHQQGFRPALPHRRD